MMQQTILNFKVSDRLLALPLEQVNQVIRAVFITPLPEPIAHISGFINMRGLIVPVIDLRTFWGGEYSPFTFETRFIITDYQNITLAIIVDQVIDVIEMPVESAKDVVGKFKLDDEGLNNVYPQDHEITIVLDITKVIQNSHLKNIDEVVESYVKS